jgi:hypothetical protein
MLSLEQRIKKQEELMVRSAVLVAKLSLMNLDLTKRVTLLEHKLELEDASPEDFS